MISYKLEVHVRFYYVVRHSVIKIASGIKVTLVSAGFLTIVSILASSTTDLSKKVGVDLYSTNYPTGSQKIRDGD
jgi:hypothetical protein